MKRLVISTIILLTIGVFFWLGSRYPQLNEKALMAEEVPVFGISFDNPFDIKNEYSIIKSIGYNTLNWIETNKKGMTFGILFAAALMLIFSLIKNKTFKSPFVNALFGIFIGAPLGVCVNCATPISLGMKKSGSSTTMALTTLISSPTFNVIVLSMLFSLFPSFMVYIKIATTLFLLLVIIPLLSKLTTKNTVTNHQLNTTETKKSNFNIKPLDEFYIEQKWFGSIIWTVKNYIYFLWKVIKIAVPLMLLAGILGNVVITLIPFDTLNNILPSFNSRIIIILVMIGISVLGTFLPVPMTFDIIISAILFSIGLPEKYVGILLFTLGCFSIYPYLIIRKNFSKKIANSLSIAVIILGVFAGLSSHIIFKMKKNYVQKNIISKLKDYKKAPYTISSPEYNVTPLVYKNINTSPAPVGQIFYSKNNISIKQIPFLPKEKPTTKKWFKAIEGTSIGINSHYNFSVENIFINFIYGRSIASGDVHHDGWPDIVIGSGTHLQLFTNTGNKTFQEQKIELPKPMFIENVALVDITGDGMLDIFFTTFSDGNYIYKNENGEFKLKNLQKFAMPKDHVLTNSLSFTDINNDGKLDIFTGNCSLGARANQSSFDIAKNFLFISTKNDSYNISTLEGQNGETLTSIFSDIDLDGDTDLIVGNDFKAPDYFYINSNNKLTLTNLKIENTPTTTMSYFTADFNNNGRLEMFGAQVSKTEFKEIDNNKVVASIQNKDEKNKLKQILDYKSILYKSFRKKDITICPKHLQIDCLMSMARKKKGNNILKLAPKKYPWLQKLNTVVVTNSENKPYNLKNTIPQKRQNVFYKIEGDKYNNIYKNTNLKNEGWSWNSKAADINNDELQDIFTVNGINVSDNNDNQRNSFYINKGNFKFKDISEVAGLDYYINTSSYSFCDVDLDGDLDIILTPNYGPVILYENQEYKNNSIIFEINDKSSKNYYGINAKIIIYYNSGKTQLKEILASGGFKSFDSPEVHFGLKNYQQIDSLKLKFSKNRTLTINKNMNVNKKYTITINK